jgi:broad specificity phosphatase PhoE
MEPAEGAEGRCVGRTDAALSTAGAAPLHILRDGWREAPGRVIASPLARARESAALLAERWSLPVEVEPRLAEMDFGEWDGRTWADIESADGGRLAEWMAAWVSVPAPGGESFLRRRRPRVGVGGRAPTRGVRPRRRPRGSIRALLCTLLELPLDAAFRLRVDQRAVSAVRLGSRRCELLFLNADHVPAS